MDFSEKDEPSMTYMSDDTSMWPSQQAAKLGNPPHCPACGETMRLSRVEPARPTRPHHQADQITYDCACGLILAQRTESPG